MLFRSDEKTLTSAETSKKEELVKKMKKGDWSERYGKRGKEVMYATATKMAKKLAEEEVSIESIQEEIRTSLLEKAHWLKENGTQEQVVEFLNNLTMEQREILNLQERDLNVGDAEAQPGGFYGQGTQQPQMRSGATVWGGIKRIFGGKDDSDQSHLGRPPAPAAPAAPAAAAAGAQQLSGPGAKPFDRHTPTPGEDKGPIQLAGPGGPAAPGSKPSVQPAPAPAQAAPAPKPAAPALDISAQKGTSEYKSYWGKHDVYESKSGKSLEKFLKEDFNGKKS